MLKALIVVIVILAIVVIGVMITSYFKIGPMGIVVTVILGLISKAVTLRLLDKMEPRGIRW